jgi:transcriptional regulator with XRE-family HTH domain
MRLFELLKKKRIEIGLTQNEVGRKIGLQTGQQIYNIESDRIVPPLPLLRCLINLYDLDENKVLGIYFTEKNNQLMSEIGLLHARITRIKVKTIGTRNEL